MFKWFKFFFFRDTTEEERAVELKEAKADLLKAEACQEYWDAQTAMLRRRVMRLSSVQRFEQAEFPKLLEFK